MNEYEREHRNIYVVIYIIYEAVYIIIPSIQRTSCGLKFNTSSMYYSQSYIGYYVECVYLSHYYFNLKCMLLQNALWTSITTRYCEFIYALSCVEIYVFPSNILTTRQKIYSNRTYACKLFKTKVICS